MEKTNLVLCDTTIVPSYEDYKDWCEMNEVEPQGEDSNDYWEFVGQMQTMEWEDFLMNINHCELSDSKWVVSGTLGLWYGNRDIVPNIHDTLEDAVCACYGSSIADIKVEKRGDVIVVTALHHDGRNYFELRALTDLGVERFERRDGQISLSNRENIQRLPEFLF